MIDTVKDILGLTTGDYDMYIAIICAVGLIWGVKQVIMAIYNTILHIFQ